MDTADLRDAARRFLSDADQHHVPDTFVDQDRFATPYRGWYSPWALRDRTRLENLQEKCLRVSLHRLFAAGKTKPALEVAHRLLKLDPLLEDVFECEIDILISLGQTVQARRRFEDCRTILRRELGVSPSERLRAKIESLQNRPITKDDLQAPIPVSAQQLLVDAQRDLRKLSELLACAR